MMFKYCIFLIIALSSCVSINKDTEIVANKEIELVNKVMDSIFIVKEMKKQECIFSILNRHDTIISISNFKLESKYSCPNLNVTCLFDSLNRWIYYNAFEKKILKLSLDEKKILNEFNLKKFDFNTGSKTDLPIIIKHQKNIILSGGGNIFIFSENLRLIYSFKESLNRDPNLNKEPVTIYVENDKANLEFENDILIVKAKIWNYYNIADKNGPYLFSDTLLLIDSCYSYTPRSPQ